MHNKALRRVEIKGAEDGPGEIEAVFATLNVKDHDGDVTVKGAFEEGAQVRISAYNHASWGNAMPVGKGTIHEVGDEVVLRGEFFNTQAGQDTRKTLKGLGSLGEWSYGFDVVDSEPGEHKGENVRVLKSMKVHEVSPVLLGAGIGTRTLGVKDGITTTFGSNAVVTYTSGGDKATLAEEIAAVVEAVGAAVKRAERVEALRAEKGQELTEATRKGLEGLDVALTELRDLLAKEETKTEASDEEAQQAYLRYLADKFREEYGNE